MKWTNILKNRSWIEILLALIGAMLILPVFIWLRFIRERLPQSIPYEMSVVGETVIFLLISIYLYTLITLALNLQFNGKIAARIREILYKPLTSLHGILKELPFGFIQNLHDLPLIKVLINVSCLSDYFRPNKRFPSIQNYTSLHILLYVLPDL
jgi:hypothetical protein